MIDPVSSAMRAIEAGPAAGADVAPLRAASRRRLGRGGTRLRLRPGPARDGVADTLKTGEATALAGINGQASTQQVVEAVMTAEQTAADRHRHPRQGGGGVPGDRSDADLRGAVS